MKQFFSISIITFSLSLSPLKAGRENLAPELKAKETIRNYLKTQIVKSSPKKYLSEPFIFLENNREIIRTQSQPPFIKDQRILSAVSPKVDSVSLDKEYFEENVFSQKMLLGEYKERRARFHNTFTWPYCTHGVVETHYLKGGASRGTGTLIGSDLVLTAAHNLYDQGKEISRIIFMPGANEHSSLEVREALNFYFPRQYKKNYSGDRGRFQNDYGLIILKHPILTTGFLGLAILPPSSLRKLKVDVTGYPAEEALKGENDYQLWGMEGDIKDIDEEKKLIIHGVDTQKGQSGSAVTIQIEGKPYIVGVHVYGGYKHNGAVLLTKDHFNQINEWIEDSNEKKAIESLNILDIQSIKELDWNLKNIGDFEVKELSTYFLPNLQKVYLGSNSIGVKGTECIRKSNWPNLSVLDLRSNRIGPKSTAQLSLGNWLSLSNLYLGFNKIGILGAEYLIKAHWPNLSTLDLQNNDIGDKELEHLSKGNWPQLSIFYLDSNRIGDLGIEHLSQANWPELCELRLNFNKIGDEGTKYLSRTNWPKLSKLYLCSNLIGDLGAIHLSKSNWPQLSILDLNFNNIGVLGMEHLYKANWPNINAIDLHLKETLRSFFSCTPGQF